MIIELIIPQEIVHNLTTKEAVEFNLTGILTPGGGSGDMTKEVYDPTGVEGDAFSMTNMVEGDDAKILTAEERLNLHTPGSDNQDLSGLATEQYVNEHIYEAFPIGSVFTTVLDGHPETMLGYGTWEEFGAGRVLIGIDTSDPDFDRAENTGGDKLVKPDGSLSEPKFTGNALPDHQHSAVSAGTPSGIVGAISSSASTATNVLAGAVAVATRIHTHPAPTFTGSAMNAHQHSANSAGTPSGTVSTPEFSGKVMTIVQPYIVVYFWKRTA